MIYWCPFRRAYRLFGFLDAPSADRILLEFQRLTAGDVIPIGISRNRASTPATVGSTLFMCLLEPAAFIMTRKMLLGVKPRRGCRGADFRHHAARSMRKLT